MLHRPATAASAACALCGSSGLEDNGRLTRHSTMKSDTSLARSSTVKSNATVSSTDSRGSGASAASNENKRTAMAPQLYTGNATHALGGSPTNAHISGVASKTINHSDGAASPDKSSRKVCVEQYARNTLNVAGEKLCRVLLEKQEKSWLRAAVWVGNL